MNQNLPENMVANPSAVSIVRNVKWNWKRISLGAALLATVLSGAGCSGIHASKSVSPLDFIMPGHALLHGQIKHEAQEPIDLIASTSPVPTLAQAE